MSTPCTDQELMELIECVARRDDTALKRLYDHTSSRLFGLALRVVGRRDAAEDVLQEAFITIWRVAGTYRETLSPPLAWMGLIVRSRALDHLRRRSSERAQLTQEFDDEVAQTLKDGDPTPADITQASQEAAALHQCLGRLESRQREVVSLAYLRDMSHGELAEQLHLPLGTVKTWIRRSLEKLRECMARYA
ncbi:RNA polymerase sigma factor [Paracidovorax konjaci]|uniref:RNA polymerase sigma-70 factor, ECF subfamily n=1 Tax=Paracidovorax konjaci TaxID=32040 RepID=A0A1I1XH36_9BURK|nr:sigma-70 family RNA polymerase sigma factor [Paracidovorax konjaci]SFE05053.1 RNA polymerase sigma-70 factor, ECF subfamily [Paracidovorax konjaci]